MKVFGISALDSFYMNIIWNTNKFSSVWLNVWLNGLRRSVENQIATVRDMCRYMSKAFRMRDFTDICMEIFCVSNKSGLYFTFRILKIHLKCMDMKCELQKRKSRTIEIFQSVKCHLKLNTCTTFCLTFEESTVQLIERVSRKFCKNFNVDED